MSAIQEVDKKSAFVFVGYVNTHHSEWLGSIIPTDVHGRAMYDISILSSTEAVRGKSDLVFCLVMSLKRLPGISTNKL